MPHEEPFLLAVCAKGSCAARRLVQHDSHMQYASPYLSVHLLMHAQALNISGVQHTGLLSILLADRRY